MDRLPPELIAHIVGYCDHASQKPVRLMNRVFEDLCSPVFEHVYVAMFEESVARLEALAASRLAKHVHRLTYLTDTLPKFSKKQYLQSIDFRPYFHQWRLLNAAEFPDEPSPHVYVADGVFSRAYSAWNALPRHSFTKQELNRGWALLSAIVPRADALER